MWERSVLVIWLATLTLSLNAAEDSEYHSDKRYVAALAKNGRLPNFPSTKEGEKRGDANDREVNYTSDLDSRELEELKEKRYIAALVKNGRYPKFENDQRDKKYIAALARENKLPNFKNNEAPPNKRYIAALAKNGRLPVYSSEKIDKRYLAALAKNGKLPVFNKVEEEKRYVAALAKNGKLPSYAVDRLSEKRDEEPIRFEEDKRYVAALAKNGKLPSYAVDRLSEKRDEEPIRFEEDKRYIAALAKNGKLPSYAVDHQDKRNLAALAKNGKLPSFAIDRQNKRYMAALAKNGKLPYYAVDHKEYALTSSKKDKDDVKSQNIQSNRYQAMEKLSDAPIVSPGSFEEDQSKEESLNDFSDYQEMMETKRYLSALAKNGKLPTYHNRNKRSLDDPKTYEDFNEISFANSDLDEDQVDEQDSALRDTLDNSIDRGNVATLARLGLLGPRISPVYTKRQSCEDEIITEKRYIGALARSGRLPPWHYGRPWWNDKRESNFIPFGYPFRHPSWSKQKRCVNKRNVAMLARKGLIPY